MNFPIVYSSWPCNCLGMESLVGIRQKAPRNINWVVGALAMRAGGMSILVIATTCGRDRQTVRHHLKKYQIEPFSLTIPKARYGQKKKVPEVVPTIGKYDYLIDELWENRALGA